MDRTLNPYPYDFFPGVHMRRHGPSGWSDYRRYRPWLRDEFAFRCVYCLCRERWMDTRRGYQIDHFVPQKIRPDLSSDYDNLLYLCAACNNLKSATLLPDPCLVPLSECLCFHDDGSVTATTPYEEEGQRLIDVLELDCPQLVEFRHHKIGTIRSHFVHNRDLYLHDMGYPSNLPDLTTEEPPHNSRPNGVAQSSHARKAFGVLPEVY